jgi:hypothetical protein
MMRTDNQMTGQQKMLPIHLVFFLIAILRQPRLQKSPHTMLLMDSMIMMQMQSIHIPQTMTTILSFQERLLKLDEIFHIGMRYACVINSQEKKKQLTSHKLITIIPQEKIVQLKHVQSSKSSSEKAASTTKIIPTGIKIKTESEGIPAHNKTKETKKTIEDDGKTKKLQVNPNKVQVNNLPDFAKN